MTVNKRKHGKNYSRSGLMSQTFPKFRVWLKNSSVTIKIILQNSKIHMKKVKKRCNIQKSMSGLLTAPKTNCFQKITSGWTPTIRSTRMRLCKNLKNPNIPGKTLYAQSKWEKKLYLGMNLSLRIQRKIHEAADNR